MKFTLFVSRRDMPHIPPCYVPMDPEDDSEMSLPRARQLAAVMLEQYITNYNLRGRSVTRARNETNSLQPGHYVDLDDVHIELRQEGELVFNA